MVISTSHDQLIYTLKQWRCPFNALNVSARVVLFMSDREMC